MIETMYITSAVTPFLSIYIFIYNFNTIIIHYGMYQISLNIKYIDNTYLYK